MSNDSDDMRERLRELLDKVMKGATCEPRHVDSDGYLVITGASKFQSGATINTYEPDKLAPILEVTLPLPSGDVKLTIEFADAKAVYNLLDALANMLIGYAYIDQSALLAQLQQTQDKDKLN